MIDFLSFESKLKIYRKERSIVICHTKMTNYSQKGEYHLLNKPCTNQKYSFRIHIPIQIKDFYNLLQFTFIALYSKQLIHSNYIPLIIKGKNPRMSGQILASRFKVR